MTNEQLLVSVITSDGLGESVFSERKFQLSGDEHRRLSDQIAAVNFRLRTSSEDYSSDFHVAGDPTLLVVLSGSIRITLRNGLYKDFSTGDMFIAEDYLSDGVEFSCQLHGHSAEVLGSQKVLLIHLKLSRR